MFALRGADPAGRLAAPELRSALVSAGAERLQVNVDDAEVAPAMRIPATEPPIDAIVSVWGGLSSHAVVDVLDRDLDLVPSSRYAYDLSRCASS